MPHIQAPFSQLHLYNSQLATFIMHVAAIHCSVCFLLNVGDYLRVRPRCIYILLYIHKHERHKSMNCTSCRQVSHLGCYSATTHWVWFLWKAMLAEFEKTFSQDCQPGQKTILCWNEQKDLQEIPSRPAVL